MSVGTWHTHSYIWPGYLPNQMKFPLGKLSIWITRTKKVHRYEVRGMREGERERESEKERERERNCKSKLEKIVEQNVTYIYLS